MKNKSKNAARCVQPTGSSSRALQKAQTTILLAASATKRLAAFDAYIEVRSELANEIYIHVQTYIYNCIVYDLDG